MGLWAANGPQNGPSLHAVPWLILKPLHVLPQVVMRRDALYTSSIDTWSLGCVFGEMLARVPYVGKSSTPQLQVGTGCWA